MDPYAFLPPHLSSRILESQTMACLLEEREVADIIRTVPEQSFLKMASGHFRVDITSKEQLITHIKHARVSRIDLLKFLFACMEALECPLEPLRYYCTQHSILEPSDWRSLLQALLQYVSTASSAPQTCTESSTTGNSSFPHHQPCKFLLLL